VSKYLAYPEIVFKSRDLLLASLADLGFSQVEEGQEVALYGYEGDRRPDTAAIVVRRRYIGDASNDLGFRLTSEGYIPIISEYDQRTLCAGQFLPRLRVAYAERVVETVRKRVRGTVHRVTEGGVIKLRVRY
jgi:Protein of unknown function (DUF1257)